ncbi:AraC family transcriptional regulator [bacterium]|nr:MAG: AraC family transcriptional regulator [bacterium]
MLPMRTATRTDYRERIVDVVAYLAEHLDRVPDLGTLAEVGGFSPFWFHRVFVAAVGESPATISRRMRLERAAWRLRTTRQPLVEIAFDAGFNDQAAFTRAFRNAYGATPGRFRSEHMPAHELPSISEIHFSPTGTPYRICLPRLEPIDMNIEYVTLEPRRYAYLRHVGPYPEIGSTFGKMADIAGPAGLVNDPEALFVGVYHNDPSATPPEELQSDAGITVSDTMVIPDELQIGTLAGGRYAKGVHKGSYSKMGESWMAFWSTLQTTDAKPRMESPFELYINDMETTPEDELITELYAAIE